MTRFYSLLILMALSSSAYASESFSFVVGGHRIRIEAPRHCSSASCVSVSIPGIYETRRRDSDDNVATVNPDPVPAKPIAPAVETRPVIAPALQPAAAPVVAAPPPIARPPAPAPQQVAAPVAPTLQSVKTTPVASPVTPPVTPPTDIVRPAPAAAPRILKASHDTEEEPAPSPLGDWQAGGGPVRIAQCGAGLCGYVLNLSSNSTGETLLINMKPKAAAEWTGNIYSRDSGNTYYAVIALKGPNSLRVEACALGKFFCSGKLWSRIDAGPRALVSSRQVSSAPRS